MRLEIELEKKVFPTDPTEFHLLISGAPGDDKQPITRMYMSTCINLKAGKRLHDKLGKLLKKAAQINGVQAKALARQREAKAAKQ